MDKALSEQHRREKAEFDATLASLGGLLQAPRRGRIPNSLLVSSEETDTDSISSSSSIASPKAIAALGLQESNIKARITNATAMGQLGIPMKRWMVDSPQSNLPTPGSGNNSIETSSSPKLLATPTSASYMPERRIGIRDLISVMSSDRQLCRSSTLYRTLLFFHSPLPTSTP